MAALQAVPDRCCAHSRDHRRRGRQRHDGARGAVRRDAVDGAGGAAAAAASSSCRSSGMAKRGTLPPKQREDPRHPGRLRRRRVRIQRQTYRDRLQPGLCGRVARAASTAQAAAVRSSARSSRAARRWSSCPAPSATSARHARRASPTSRPRKACSMRSSSPTSRASSAARRPTGVDFGAAHATTQAMIDQPYQFDFYDGGGLDLAFLGLRRGRSQRQRQRQPLRRRASSAPAASSTSARTRKPRRLLRHLHRRRPARSSVGDGALRDRREGRHRKFVETVEQITFSGDFARERGPAACCTSPSAPCSG